MTTELLPADLESSHLGQYIRVSVENPQDNQVPEVTFLVGKLVEIEHALDGPDDDTERTLFTTATIQILTHRTRIVLPSHIVVDVAEGAEELVPRTREVTA